MNWVRDICHDICINKMLYHTNNDASTDDGVKGTLKGRSYSQKYLKDKLLERKDVTKKEKQKMIIFSAKTILL